MKEAKDLIIPFAWAERKEVLLERFFYVPAPYEHTEKTISFFEKDQPIFIEFCSGNGEWIAKRAEAFPMINWLAVEKRFDRARKIWLKSFRHNLPNLCVVCSEGLLFSKYYAPKVQEIFINFPDPWPKRRHASHRIISKEFLKELSKMTESGAKTTCVTDDAPYAELMLKEFLECPDWKLLHSSTNLPDYGGSFFKDLWTSFGRTIHHLCFERL